MKSPRLRFHLVAAAVLSLAVAAGPALVGDEAFDHTTRLTALAKVWGLLKYFHPQVAQGSLDWDTALLDAIPHVKAADTKAAFNEEIMRLIDMAGPPRVPATAPLEAPEANPAFGWLDDQQVFAPETIAALKAIRHGEVPSSNRYVRPVPSVGNPDFSGEAPYDDPPYPREEMRLLALFRFWNMFQFYAPNRDVLDRNWADVLPALIPRFIEAANPSAYHLAVCELTASINDTHAFTGSSTLTLYWGTHAPAIRTRFIESQTVVTKVVEQFAGGADVRPGDVVTDIDGVATADRRERLRPYAWASNDGSRQRTIDSLLLRTGAGFITLGLSRFGVRKSVTMSTQPVATLAAEETALEARRPKWTVLDGNVGYVHMGILQQADVPAMWEGVRNTRAIVFDVRNYPNGTMFLIAQRLNPGPREFATFTRPRYEQPGTLTWVNSGQRAGPPSPTSNYYRGRVILLGDDRTQSHAEYTMMALRTAPDVTVVGTPTSGADGNVSLIALPGGLRTYFSGLGVFYPDRTPTQRVGIVPDVVVEPTIAGIQAGVDEVLNRALDLVR